MEVAKFHKVSLEQFCKDAKNCFPIAGQDCFENTFSSITLPERSTSGSAGYDFVLPFDIVLEPGETALIPTGICAEIRSDWMLALFPRSGLGFKYRMQLDNTVGIIDSDYYFAENGGHIMAKVTNDTNDEKTLFLHAGDRFMQGIFIQYGTVYEDNACGTRTGGIGSTGMH